MIETTNHSWKRVPDIVLRDSRLEGSDIAVFACLLDMCKDTLQIDVSCKEITSRTSRSRRTVMYSLARLEKYGYIERKTVSGGISTYFLAELVPAEKKRKRKPTSKQNPELDEPLPGQLDFFSEPNPGRQLEHKTCYGKYQHVMLTAEESNLLRSLYNEKILKLYIQKLDEYCELYGKSYENYYLAIKKWIEGDKQKNPKAFEKQKSKLTDEELAGYLSLVNRFKDD